MCCGKNVKIYYYAKFKADPGMFSYQNRRSLNRTILRPLWLMTSAAADVISVPSVVITHTIESCWIPSQNKVEWPWRYRSRSKVITTKYGKNPSRTVDATERTRFSRSRPNDLKNIGHGQRSSHATHPLILVIICAKYERIHPEL